MSRRALTPAIALAVVASAGGLAMIPFASQADESQQPAPTASTAGPLSTTGGLYHPYAWTIESYASQMSGSDAASLQNLAKHQTTRWMMGGSEDIAQLTQMISGGVKDKGAASDNSLASVVLYNIPNRDCGSYSGGGASSAEAYRAWVDKISQTIGKAKMAVVLEPDALHVTSCLSDAQRTERFGLINYATQKLKANNPNAVTYIAAGEGSDTATMADRLKEAGVANTRGYALNVANFDRTATSVAYGKALNSALGADYHFVIDTSRNGSGPSGAKGEAAWCNPPGRTVGEKPTTNTGDASVDAYLWIKDQTVDGACTNSNPVSDPAQYTLQIAKDSGY